MSRQPIARSPDLRRLQNEGYDLEILGGLLLIRDIPYVNASAAVERGTLVMKLNLAGDVVGKPPDHTAHWIGAHPCHASGAKISSIENPSGPADLGNGIRANFMFSAKADYRDYHHKVTTYVGRIAGEAAKVDPTATAMTFPPIATNEKDSVFKYADTASSRAGIDAINAKLVGQKIGIIGSGGTGAYVLDLVAKTLVAEIHIFDGDTFLNHNAFRAPGAPSLERLREKPQKVDYLGDIYDKMRNGIFRHDTYIDALNAQLLDGFDFVFVCMDRGASKRIVVQRLVANGIPFIEVGMGIINSDGQLGGIARVVCSIPETRQEAEAHISYAEDDGGANEYATNIQIAELNALNAAMAVIRWKQHFGIYQDHRGNFYQGYSIASGEVIGEGIR